MKTNGNSGMLMNRLQYEQIQRPTSKTWIDIVNWANISGKYSRKCFWLSLWLRYKFRHRANGISEIRLPPWLPQLDRELTTVIWNHIYMARLRYDAYLDFWAWGIKLYDLGHLDHGIEYTEPLVYCTCPIQSDLTNII